MDAISNDMPFPRGVYDDPLAAVNVGHFPAAGKLVGRNFQHLDLNLLSTALQGSKPVRSGEPVTVRLMKNNSGVVLPAKRIVVEDPDVPGSVTSLAVVGDIGKRLYVVDEYSPASIPINALFWAVTRGRTIISTSSVAGDISTSITVGMYISPVTGGFANGNGQIEAAATDLTSTTLRIIRSLRIESRTAATATTGVNTDLTAYVHGMP